MRAGLLRHRITLQTPTSAPDGDGGFVNTWPPDGGATLATNVPASIEPASLLGAAMGPAMSKDMERVIAGTVLSSATHLVTMRYLDGVTTKTRVLFGSRVLNVTGVQNPEERNISLVLICQEIVT